MIRRPAALRPAARVLPGALGLCLLAGSVRAQSVDYEASEMIFGEPVTASVTGKPQRAADAPANIEIITQDAIRRSGATSIPEVLQWVPGVDVRMTGPGNAEVGMRGYNQSSNPHLMVLVNGRQVYMADYGRIIWSSIPVQLDEIRQIEVIKGPNAALYGFNAVSGVINIITYDPLKDRLNVATTRVGTSAMLQGDAVGTGRIGNTAGLRLSLGGFRSNDYPGGTLPAAEREGRQNPFSGTFAADARWQVTPSVEVFADASLGNTRLPDQGPLGVFQSETLVGSSARLGVQADTPLGLLSLSAYRSDERNDISAIGQMGQQIVKGEYQATYVVEASDLLKPAADHTLRVGFEFRRYDADSGNFLLGTIATNILAASLMWDWQLTSDLALTNAVRLDDVTLAFSGTRLPGSGATVADFGRVNVAEPSFNSGLVWRATGQDTLRLSLARGVQLPTLMEYAVQIPHGFLAPAAAFYGEPHLNPTSILSSELDYDRSLSALDSVLRSAVFAERLDNIVSWPFGAPPALSALHTPVFYAQNVGYSTGLGGELAIKGHNAAGFRWNASYAFVATTNHTALAQGPVVKGTVDYVHSTPSHVVDAGVGYTHARLELDLMARWQSSYLDFRANAARNGLRAVNVDNYVTMTARVGYRVTDAITAALVAQQFNQSQLFVTAGSPTQRQFLASLTIHL
jgi:iron complex outermembrane receptor protein